MEKSIHVDSYDLYKNDEYTNIENHSKMFVDLWDENDIILISNLFKSATKSINSLSNDIPFLSNVEVRNLSLSCSRSAESTIIRSDFKQTI